MTGGRAGTAADPELPPRSSLSRWTRSLIIRSSSSIGPASIRRNGSRADFTRWVHAYRHHSLRAVERLHLNRLWRTSPSVTERQHFRLSRPRSTPVPDKQR